MCLRDGRPRVVPDASVLAALDAIVLEWAGRLPSGADGSPAVLSLPVAAALCHQTGLAPAVFTRALSEGCRRGLWAADPATRSGTSDRAGAPHPGVLLAWLRVPADRAQEQHVLGGPLIDWMEGLVDGLSLPGMPLNTAEARHAVLARTGHVTDTDRKRVARWREAHARRPGTLLVGLLYAQDTLWRARRQPWDLYDGTPGRPRIPDLPPPAPAGDAEGGRWCPRCREATDTTGRACNWCGEQTLKARPSQAAA